MDIKWSIEKVTVSGDNQLITRVYWGVQGVDNEDTVAGSGWRDLEPSDSFTDYASLTEAQVLDWIWAPVTTESKDFEGNVTGTVTTRLKDAAEAQLADQIARRRADVVATPALPWTPSVPSPL
jgi:hypothetical protein